jgi:hypothetical protein
MHGRKNSKLCIVISLAVLEFSYADAIAQNTSTTRQIEQIMTKMLDTLSKTYGKSRFFILGKHSCSSCSDRAIDNFIQSPLANDIGIITLGQGYNYTTMKNILTKNRVRFLYADEKIFDLIEKIDPGIATTLIIGAVKTKNNEYKFVFITKNYNLDSLIQFISR